MPCPDCSGPVAGTSALGHVVVVEYRFQTALEAMRFAEQLTVDLPPNATRWTVGEVRDGQICGLKVSA